MWESDELLMIYATEQMNFTILNCSNKLKILIYFSETNKQEMISGDKNDKHKSEEKKEKTIKKRIKEKF